MLKRVMAVFALILIAAIGIIYSLYHTKLAESGSAEVRLGFWAATVFIGVWLILAVVHVLRKGP